MSADTSEENGSNGSYCSDDEDIDGLIAAVLQDLEIEDAINEGREEGSDQEGKTGYDTQTNHIGNVLSPPIHNNAANNNNNNTIPHTSPLIPMSQSHSVPMTTQKQSVPNVMMIKQHSLDHIVDKENQRRIDIKIALAKICNILREVDEDGNGEVDYEEFQEGLRLIDSNLNHVEIEQIYQHFVWNEEDELNIKLFIDLLDERCRSTSMGSIHSINPKSLLQCSFKFIKTTPLNKIYDILKEKDEDENMCIDWSEFEEAMLDLEVNLNRNYLEMIYSTICAKENHKEVNIKLLLKELSIQGGIENMNSAEILSLYFTSLISMNDWKKKKVRQSSMSVKGRKKLKRPKFTRFNSMSLLSTASILKKSNCSVIVMNALRRELCEVDDNNDGKVDCVEFTEALLTLKSSYKGSRATKVFYNMVNVANGELSINKFINDISKMYLKYPGITGDQCIDKVSQINVMNHHRQISLCSLSSNYSMRSVLSLPEEKEEEHDQNIVKQIQNIVNLCADGNGTVDREELIDILSEWSIDEKFNDDELSLIFNELCDIDEEEASCHMFMRRVQEVHIDHPNYSPRRAVYRVCRRLLKAARKHH